jgi:DNA-binding response OmpR family regulator
MGDQPTRVVIIEDDTNIAGLVQLAIQDHAVATLAHNAADGENAVQAVDPHVVVLDLGLPDRDGIEVLRELRVQRPHIGILCLTARVEEVERIIGFEVGADDYVTKPFSPRELSGRIRALARRVVDTAPAPAQATTTIDSVVIDHERREVSVGGTLTEFTRLEFDLLAHLAVHRGKALGRTDLLRDVWGHEWLGGSRTVDVHVAQLRRKLDDHATVSTVRGVGYRLE